MDIRFQEFRSNNRNTASGRYCKPRRQRSSRWCSAGVLLPEYRVQQPFGPAQSARPNDRLVQVSVSTPASGDRLLTLHCSPTQLFLERQQIERARL